MYPVSKEHTTRTLGKPDGWDAKRGPCIGLPVTDAEGIMYSYWKPTIIERLRILFGRQVRLAVVGSAHPPVAVDTEL